MSSPARPTRKKPSTVIFRYLFSRLFTISITILLGIFGTVVLVNRTNQLDKAIYNQARTAVNRKMWSGAWSSTEQEGYQETFDRLLAEELSTTGYNLPFLPKHLMYTTQALTFDWGEMLGYNPALTAGVGSTEIRDIILSRLPNTLLLMGAAYLLLFFTGIPLGLWLSRRNDSTLDRLFTFLSPISSVPAWVHGVLLILLIGISVQWLPISGMYDHKPPTTQIGYIEVVLRHMILPVTAILLSLYFQLVYTWRTYFLLFSEEEYVDLAVAKGVDSRTLQNKYILRPGLPYVLTSFAMTLVSFWQTTTALEVVFQWPGIGYTYIKSLPHYFGESVYPGELAITIGIVVIFAYLLGVIILLLDFLYVLVDPRIRLEQGNTSTTRIKVSIRKRKSGFAIPAKPAYSARHQYHEFKRTLQRFTKELRHYPSAMIGLSILLLFFFGSLYAVIFYPYSSAGAEWNSDTLIHKSYAPKTANPKWTNFFRQHDLPESFELSSDMPEVLRADFKVGENPNTIYIFQFDYDYTGDIPQEILFFYQPKIDRKIPFVYDHLDQTRWNPDPAQGRCGQSRHHLRFRRSYLHQSIATEKTQAGINGLSQTKSTRRHHIGCCLLNQIGMSQSSKPAPTQ